MNQDFKEPVPRKEPTPIRLQRRVSTSLPPDGPAHQSPLPQRTQSTDANGEKAYAAVHGKKLVAAFERCGSVAVVARSYKVKCSTVEIALADRLKDFRKAA